MRSLCLCGLLGPDSVWHEGVECPQTALKDQGDKKYIPGKPAASNYRLLSVFYSLLWGIVACCFGLLGFQLQPSTRLFSGIPFFTFSWARILLEYKTFFHGLLSSPPGKLSSPKQ